MTMHSQAAMQTNMKIATWNINSIRQRLPHLLQWVEATKPDIVLLQETKAQDAQFPQMELEAAGYELAFSGQKTFNGVAILSRYPLQDVITQLPGDDGDEQKRYIEAVVALPDAAVRVASVYVPNGQAPDSDKFAYKMRFLERLRAHAAELLKEDTPLILGGDYNIAPLPIDVVEPEKKDGTICYHPLERQQWHALLHLGMYDAFRSKQGAVEQAFSWWDYRAAAFERNDGYRIDHLLLSAEAIDCCNEAGIDTSPRGWQKPSDHTPVWCDLAL